MVENSSIHQGCGKPWDLHTEGTVGDTELPALHCPGVLEKRERGSAEIVRQGQTVCSCGEVLKGFAVDVGCIYEPEFPDETELYAKDTDEAVAFCDGYTTFHDVIYYQSFFSGSGKPEGKRHEGTHQEVPKVETSQLPRHPFFFREKERSSDPTERSSNVS